MCVFCDIIQKKLDADIIFEDNDIITIKDVNPKAPVHFLVIPKKHIESIKELSEVDEKLLMKIIKTAKESAEKVSLSGYKLIFNVGKEGGQIIDHLHLHLLGGWKNKPHTVDI